VTAPPLQGRVALVAGGSGPIGAAVAQALHGVGAAVAVHYRSQRERAEAIAEQCDGLAVAADLTDAGNVEALVGRVERELGAVVVMVNAAHAADQAPAPVAQLEVAELERQLGGLRAHHLLCRAVLPGMRRAGFGRIVYLAGALMARPSAGFGAYAAAKAAASALTRYVALEEGRYGITANVVAPGRVAQPGEPEPDDPTLRALSARLVERMAFERFPCAEEVAGTVLALTLPTLSALTGQVLWVTGGEPIS
jgi:NAD(P)-dependent dehydrogenase (short-subunit alcohol dehydrogenase family)